jgi:hypothetical protein
MLLSKCKFTVENYDTIINPVHHFHFKQPLFETRERPIPIHIEIEEENCMNEEEVKIIHLSEVEFGEWPLFRLAKKVLIAALSTIIYR